MRISRQVQPVASSISALETSIRKKEAEHEKFLARTSGNPTPENSGHVILRGSRFAASSSTSLIGAVDPIGMHEDARAWLRETESTENADKFFFSPKAQTTSARLWNDPAVKDSEFAADAEIVDHRQFAAQRPTSKRYLNVMLSGGDRTAGESTLIRSSATKASTL